jgi:DNA-directed RNA polymerase specialized sigma24 family protein
MDSDGTFAKDSKGRRQVLHGGASASADAHLPEDEREAFGLVRVQGTTQAEAARGCSASRQSR